MADDFTVERAVNLSQLESWTDISQFQWQEIDHIIQDNGAEMDALKAVFRDPVPKDTVGFYKQIYDARDNQYIVLRLDKAQGNRPFHIRVTCVRDTTDASQNTSKVFSANNYAYIFLAEGCRKVSGRHLDATECMETAVLSAGIMEEMIAECRVIQAVHVAAYYMAREKQRAADA